MDAMWPRWLLTILALWTFPQVAALPELAMVGLGTAGIKKVSTMVEAIQMGYRTLDTALIYQNHAMVRQAMEESHVPREEIFLTSKVSFFPSSLELPKEHQSTFGMTESPLPPELTFHPFNVKGKEIEGIELSLQELGVEYLDLCLIHAPSTSALELWASFLPHLYGYWPKMPSWTEPLVLGATQALTAQEVEARKREAYQQRKRSWLNMEEAKRRGFCRHIGVSNYPVQFMQEIEEYQTEPIYNEQQELHPLAQFRDVQEYTKKAKIFLTGFGTGVVADTPAAEQIARRIGRSPGQVLLRWAVQHQVHVTPKSNQLARLRENLEVLDFELSDADMATLDALDASKVFYWNTSILVPKADRKLRDDL
ncbi:unnamed protein product [Durusdinium trenchii]|uniref:Uncharacterized oxidoreductase Mmcs_1938 n=2 Tax=Durusdinium trenchii TaxID=1381693 RepID=A0ABP0KFF6_9DINO